MSSLFGKSTTDVGTTSTDLLLKTRGGVKIQMGRKFIDLLKDGKINADAEFIYETDSVGKKDGFYVINGSVVLKIGDQQINMVSQNDTTYVSFLESQETSADQKYTAMTNIGFIYNSLSDVDSSALQNGIIYVEGTNTLYIISDGVLTDYSQTIDLPNPYTKQFVITKSSSGDGAIVITGEGSENSLMFDTMMLYVEDGTTYLDSDGKIAICINGTKKANITTSYIEFTNDVVTTRLMSDTGATSENGFRLYYDSGESTLEVDNISVRNGIQTNGVIYPTLWFAEQNVVKSVSYYYDDDDGVSLYDVTLKYKNEYQVGDTLYCYVDEDSDDEDSDDEDSDDEDSDDEDSGLSVIALTVQSVDDDDIICYSTTYPVGYIENKVIFLVGREDSDSITITRIGPDGLDLINSSSADDEQDITSITTRVGNLEELDLMAISSGDTEQITGTGIYTDNGAFYMARYISSYSLPISDDSSKMASTEWVHDLFPPGVILMYNDSENIPDGWALCDGTNGTPKMESSYDSVVYIMKIY